MFQVMIIFWFKCMFHSKTSGSNIFNPNNNMGQDQNYHIKAPQLHQTGRRNNHQTHFLSTLHSLFVCVWCISLRLYSHLATLNRDILEGAAFYTRRTSNMTLKIQNTRVYLHFHPENISVSTLRVCRNTFRGQIRKQFQLALSGSLSHPVFSFQRIPL